MQFTAEKFDGGKARAFQREDFVSGLQPMNGKMPPRLSVFFPATSAGIRPYAYDGPSFRGELIFFERSLSREP